MDVAVGGRDVDMGCVDGDVGDVVWMRGVGGDADVWVWMLQCGCGCGM